MPQDVADSEFYVTYNYIKERLPAELSQPKVAIICGSGLGGLADTIDETKCKKVEFKYEDIPGFVTSTVQGHVSKLVFGLLGKNQTPTVCMVGRYHFYEGHSLKQVTLPVRIFKLLGVEVLIVTNASGALNKDFRVGKVAVLTDHISLPGLAGNNPLFGPNLGMFGPRFPPMTDVYDYDLRVLAFKAASSLKFDEGTLKEAIYCFVGGPSYETKAEARFLRTIGGDIVGMSTVPEVIVARHSGIRVLGLSLVTNMVALRKDKSADPSASVIEEPEEPPPKHEEVLEVSKARAHDMQNLVKTIVGLI
ncbi:inosine guanosine and [Rhizophagus irregularis]|uniref:Purine nucleoside phosphorylase n=4 Tax=Rhizophagus irregularis TaxID=588596 RepID=A0A2I1ECP2_9GLOM|eukprot:XP_025185546.1 nucleoside phosphorylase domain-containing protein [Rhizophagus irregularis DAOM 181602=DAOM 197198]